MKVDAAAIEAVLFVSSSPVTTSKLCQILDTDEASVLENISALKSELSQRGINLISSSVGHQLVSSAKYHQLTAPIVEQTAPTLSAASLEVLTIIAHRQPISKTEIEKIRGVSSDQTIKNLLSKNLIRKSSKKQSPLDPSRYETTIEFLRQCGLSSIDELGERI